MKKTEMKAMKSRKHVNENMEQHIEYPLPLQVGNASEKIKTNCEMIIRSFQKCEITTVVDSSKDDQVNIKAKNKDM